MISKGSLYHIESDKYLDSEVSPIELLHVVRKFPKVFPNDLLRIPPEGEIYFGINLIQDSNPFLIPPYQIAPAELNDLKAQLKDLLHKGFIRPTISP